MRRAMEKRRLVVIVSRAQRVEVVEIKLAKRFVDEFVGKVVRQRDDKGRAPHTATSAPELRKRLAYQERLLGSNRRGFGLLFPAAAFERVKCGRRCGR